MNVYFLARIRVHDEAEYQQYLHGCDEVFARYNGEYLAVDDSPETLEGDWPEGRMVLIRFPGEEEFRRWYESAEYRDLLAHRLQGALCDTALIRGK